MNNNEQFEIVKYSDNRDWLIAKCEDRYYIFDTTGEKPTPLKTPSGKLCDTSYYVLADRVLCDLEEYGEDNMTGESIIPWHFTMVDNFYPMQHEQVVAMLNECFLQKYDWTYDFGYEKVFGDSKTRVAEIKEWLSECTHMQMTAACCIGNAYHSINVAYVLALIMENCNESLWEEQFQLLAEMLEKHSMFDDVESILRVLDTFRFYYGIHFEEDGPIINKSFTLIEDDDSNDESYDDSDIAEDEEDEEDEEEDTERAVAIVTELLKIGRKDGFIISEHMPYIPELIIHSADIAMRLFEEIAEYGKTNPQANTTRLTFVWCAYAGIGAVYHWHTDWNALSHNGIWETLTKKRGVYEMDEYVHDCIGKPFFAQEGKELNAHLANMAECCIYRLASKGNITFEKVFETAKALYLYGMVFEMNERGML